MSPSQPNFVLMPGDDDVQSPVDALRRRALRLLKQADDAPNDEPFNRRQTGFAAPAALGPTTAPPARAVAVGVVTMPAVFVVVVLLALALFGKPAASPDVAAVAGVETLAQPRRQVATSASFAATTGFANNAIGIGEDARIDGVSLDGNRIAIHVESPNGAEIMIYDFVDGRVVARAPIVTAGLDHDDRLAALTGAPPVARLSLITPAIEPMPDAPASAFETRDGAAPLAPRVKPDAQN